ncbi:hypothetical protein A3842_03670 [Paenibacillus sp. P3E]|nr:hypothetical protein A3842_03670 [Paenibacillus sp. P3E]
MHLRSLKKTKKDVSLNNPIGTDKEGNEFTLIDILEQNIHNLNIFDTGNGSGGWALTLAKKNRCSG